MVGRNVRYVIRRENNVVEVDFRREPDPPAPRFPGASGLRRLNEERRESGWSFGDEGFSWIQAGRKSPLIWLPGAVGKPYCDREFNNLHVA
jgi:hypothetical protein